MTYSEAKKLKKGDIFTHKRWTGIYTIENVEILPKKVKCRCSDGYTYEHTGIKTLVQ